MILTICCQMVLTMWFVRWYWQYDLSDDIDNLICQMIFVRWYWQYDLSDDICEMIFVRWYWQYAQARCDFTGKWFSWWHRPCLQIRLHSYVMHTRSCTMHMWPSCVVCLVSSWLLLCLKETFLIFRCMRRSRENIGNWK